MYQALYRQWRVNDFASMIGQEAVMKTLRNQVKTGRIAHAYLFCGSRGTGKTSTARILARAINCRNPKDGDACGECESCKTLLSDASMDVIEIDAASNNSVDEIRDLREKVKYPPQQSKYKVYIIDEVHMLSAGAFNALLKTLEEPPRFVVFVLATTEPQKLPATILSRCQRFDFGRIPARKIAGRLEEAAKGAGADAEHSALMLIASAAEGGMRDALSILDMCLGRGEERITEELVRSVLGASDRSFCFKFAHAIITGDKRSVMLLIEELVTAGREPLVFMKDMAQHFRALAIASACPDDIESLLDITKDTADEYIRQSGEASQAQVIRVMELFTRAQSDMRYASQPRILLEIVSLRACLLPEEENVAAIMERVERLEREGVRAAPAPEAPSAYAPAPAAAPVVISEPVQAPKMTPLPGYDGAESEAIRRSIEMKMPAQEKPKPAQSLSDALKQRISEPEKKQEAQAAPTNMLPREVWDKAMLAIKRGDPRLYSSLMFGHLGGVENGRYQLVFPQDKRIFYNLLSTEGKAQPLADALTQAGGVPAGVDVVLEGSRQDLGAQKKADDQLKQLSDIFGRDKIQVID